MAWQCISTEMNVTGFKKWCVPNATDGIDDDIWNDRE